MADGRGKRKVVHNKVDNSRCKAACLNFLLLVFEVVFYFIPLLYCILHNRQSI